MIFLGSDDMKKLYLGIDIGGTKCAVVAGESSGEIYERIEIPSSREMPPCDIIDKLIIIAQNLMSKYGDDNRKFVASGISCGGPLNSRTGTIQAPPNLPLWENIQITSILAEKLGIPAYLQNDANACAIAEWQFGNGRGKDNVIFLTFGTGLGAGLILNGQIYDGASGMAGEVGHIRLAKNGPIGYHKEGSFEGDCSGGGIKHLAQIIVSNSLEYGEKTTLASSNEDIGDITAKMVFEKAEEGDKLAQEVVDICAENLGKGLAILVDVLNPECIIIGSIYTRCENMLKDKMYKVLKKEALPQSLEACEILPSYLKDKVGDYAAITVAMINE